MFYCLLTSVQQPVTNDESITLELILSILALVISIGSVGFEYFYNQKINRTNLEADFFKDIYGDFLMHKIPKARTVIHYNNQIISDTDDLIEALNDIRRSSLFYNYQDPKFYKALSKHLQNLEDELVSKTGEILDNNEYLEFIQEINSDIETIYGIIMNKYIGKK